MENLLSYLPHHEENVNGNSNIQQHDALSDQINSLMLKQTKIVAPNNNPIAINPIAIKTANYEQQFIPTTPSSKTVTNNALGPTLPVLNNSPKPSTPVLVNTITMPLPSPIANPNSSTPRMQTTPTIVTFKGLEKTPTSLTPKNNTNNNGSMNVIVNSGNNPVNNSANVNKVQPQDDSDEERDESYIEKGTKGRGGRRSAAARAAQIPSSVPTLPIPTSVPGVDTEQLQKMCNEKLLRHYIVTCCLCHRKMNKSTGNHYVIPEDVLPTLKEKYKDIFTKLFRQKEGWCEQCIIKHLKGEPIAVLTGESTRRGKRKREVSEATNNTSSSAPEPTISAPAEKPVNNNDQENDQDMETENDSSSSKRKTGRGGSRIEFVPDPSLGKFGEEKLFKRGCIYCSLCHTWRRGGGAKKTKSKYFVIPEDSLEAIKTQYADIFEVRSSSHCKPVWCSKCITRHLKGEPIIPSESKRAASYSNSTSEKNGSSPAGDTGSTSPAKNTSGRKRHRKAKFRLEDDEENESQEENEQNDGNTDEQYQDGENENSQNEDEDYQSEDAEMQDFAGEAANSSVGEKVEKTEDAAKLKVEGPTTRNSVKKRRIDEPEGQKQLNDQISTIFDVALQAVSVENSVHQNSPLAALNALNDSKNDDNLGNVSLLSQLSSKFSEHPSPTVNSDAGNSATKKSNIIRKKNTKIQENEFAPNSEFEEKTPNSSETSTPKEKPKEKEEKNTGEDLEMDLSSLLKANFENYLKNNKVDKGFIEKKKADIKNVEKTKIEQIEEKKKRLEIEIKEIETNAENEKKKLEAEIEEYKLNSYKNFIQNECKKFSL